MSPKEFLDFIAARGLDARKLTKLQFDTLSESIIREQKRIQFMCKIKEVSGVSIRVEEAEFSNNLYTIDIDYVWTYWESKKYDKDYQKQLLSLVKGQPCKITTDVGRIDYPGYIPTNLPCKLSIKLYFISVFI